jgi:general nucleoside transport system ATP-binding protein
MDIQLRHIHKYFGLVHANNDLSLDFASARIIGVLGENGAGKSTLMKILSGFQPADYGEIWIDGALVNFTGPEVALQHGIGMLQQDPLDVGAFTVIENFLYGYPGGPILNRRDARTSLHETCRRLSFDLEPDQPVSDISIASRQQLEIARLIALGVHTLILDEPTTGISEEQKATLFETLRVLAHDEAMTILLVSHKLEDVIALCDEVVVLRAGRFVGQRAMPATKRELVHLMFGQDFPQTTRRMVDFTDTPVALSLDRISVRTERLALEDFTLEIRAGEVIGLAGLDGSGQDLLMRAACGLMATDSGTIALPGKRMTGASYLHFLAEGVYFGSAGRVEEGLIGGMSLTDHFALIQERGFMVNWRRARQHTADQIARFNVRGEPSDPIESLSGGNQQRVLMALLPDHASVLILQQPTRGLDVDSARWIWTQLLEKTAQGTAILYSSAEMEELLTYSDRIIVLFAGHAFEVTNPEDLTVTQLGHLIGGTFVAQLGHLIGGTFVEIVQ